MRNIFAIALVVAAAGISAQTISSASSDIISYTTVDVYESCSDPATTDTVTSTVVITTCPECTMTRSDITHTTVYTTVYETLCSTGLSPVTTTITETCVGPTPTWSRGPSYIPPGFTVTTMVCTVCHPKSTSMPVTLTVPCGCTNGGSHGTSTGSVPSNGSQPTNGSGGATTCPGTTFCPQTSGTGTSHQVTNPTSPPFSAAAYPIATVITGLVGGAFAAAGVILM